MWFLEYTNQSVLIAGFILLEGHARLRVDGPTQVRAYNVVANVGEIMLASLI